MVWTVEGLDAPPNLERLVHVSFSSCLPHIFPPHLSQSLRQDLLQFLAKEPDVSTRGRPRPKWAWQGEEEEEGRPTSVSRYPRSVSPAEGVCRPCLT